jgi:hypothetical protein
MKVKALWMLEVKASGERKGSVAMSLDYRVKASVAYVEQGDVRSNSVKEVREMCPKGLGCVLSTLSRDA